MSKLRPAVGPADHIQGSAHAAIELVEYGDYECPHCGRAYPVIKHVQQTMGDDLKFVFRNFPLSEMHPHALNAAVATEAAGAQGRFWEMHDIIFENQQHLGDAHLIRYAATVGLDVPQFEQDFEQPQFMQKVEADFERGVRSGVNGTPSLFINGVKYNGMVDEESLLEHLRSL